MNAHFKILPQAIATIDAGSKQAILEALAERFCAAYDLDRIEVLDGLEEREKLSSTGFGRGIAIPHARIQNIRRPVVSLLRLRQPVAFGSVDALPVDLVFGLISPTNSGAGHLQALAAISRLARDEAIHEALSESDCPDAIFALLSSHSDRDVA